MSAGRIPPPLAGVSTDPGGFDEAAVLVAGGEEQWLEATMTVLPDGRELLQLFDEQGEVAVTVSFRPGFMLRREAARAEAAA